MKIDAHHHLWDLSAVRYTWLMEKDVQRFFGDPKPIQRNYLLSEHQNLARVHGFTSSVHIQVGVVDPLEEARWVDRVACNHPDWPIKQMAFCDLTARDLTQNLDALQRLSSVVGVRQIVGRSAEEDSKSGTNHLLSNPQFLAGLKELAKRGLLFDLQITPPIMRAAADVFAQVPELPVALCHAGSPHERTKEGIQSWAENLKALSMLPNMSCKISGLGMFSHGWSGDDFRPIIKEVLEQFSPTRCMFGSNFPVCSLTSSYAALVDAIETIVPKDDHHAVFTTTAQNWYWR